MYNIPFSPPDITQEEIEEVIDTLKSGWITTGPKTKKFEVKIKVNNNSQTLREGMFAQVSIKKVR